MGTYCRKLTPFGRRLLVDRILVEGWPVAHAAEAAGVSRQTAYRWLKRWEREGEAGLLDRSSRPHFSPNRVSSETEQLILADRVTEKEGPHVMAGRLGVPRSTIYRVLRRRGPSRLSDLDRTSVVPIRKGPPPPPPPRLSRTPVVESQNRHSATGRGDAGPPPARGVIMPVASWNPGTRRPGRSGVSR